MSKETTMTGTDIADVVKQYMAAWNALDAAERQALLDQCWSEDGVYLDPRASLTGRDALARHIGAMQASRPGARLEFMSGIDAHHNVVRFLWRLVRADGSHGDISIDFGEIGPDGRLARIIGFFGPPPALP